MTSPVEVAWDDAAQGYDAYFSPRFAPYLATALGTLIGRASELPTEGGILVPCAGPGHELAALARAFPARQILASDLSGEMVRLARQRNADFANVSVERDDATQLRPPTIPIAALYSVFGLQLLPKPADTLGHWLELLAPKGLATIVYWPREAGGNGPFATVHRLLAEWVTVDDAWQRELEASARSASAHVREDVRIAFPMQFDDARSLWQALTRLGPLRALGVARGEAFIARLGARFEAEFPAGEPLSDSPEARLLLLERD
ncbi:MAG TPA: methyltransferase domain-containing protein [Polyangiaceae bacterium]|nr:methyltransferase domain-containing protein [Polyangiaceae bacterium]